jgi:hypothetical protein
MDVQKQLNLGCHCPTLSHQIYPPTPTHWHITSNPTWNKLHKPKMTMQAAHLSEISQQTDHLTLHKSWQTIIWTTPDVKNSSNLNVFDWSTDSDYIILLSLHVLKFVNTHLSFCCEHQTFAQGCHLWYLKAIHKSHYIYLFQITFCYYFSTTM